jgi:hypothetical protein
MNLADQRNIDKMNGMTQLALLAMTGLPKPVHRPDFGDHENYSSHL